MTPAGAAASPIGVRLGQVRAPTINGNSLYTTTSGYGITPTVAWSPPSAGTPTSYEVTVYRLFSSNGTGAREVVLTMQTDQTSVTIPPGHLVSGDSYVFAIAARADATPSAVVYRSPLPRDTSTVLSVLSTP